MQNEPKPIQIPEINTPDQLCNINQSSIKDASIEQLEILSPTTTKNLEQEEIFWIPLGDEAKMDDSPRQRTRTKSWEGIQIPVDEHFITRGFSPPLLPKRSKDVDFELEQKQVNDGLPFILLD
jgi:hypothetical protein